MSMSCFFFCGGKEKKPLAYISLQEASFPGVSLAAPLHAQMKA